MRGDGIDAAVADAFLAAMQPAHLAISLATLEQVTAQARQVERQWQLRLERARYEAERVGRQYRLVEPENRVVARTLEREWNERLTALEALEREYAALPSPTAHLASPAQQQRILALAQDLPAIWHAATTAQAERKQLLRFLIKDLTLTRTPTALQVGLRWQTEALSTLHVPLPVRSADARRTPATVVTRVQALAPDHTDAQIATLLCQEVAGILDAVSTMPHGPRWIALSPETIARLRKPTHRQWTRRRVPGAGPPRRKEAPPTPRTRSRARSHPQRGLTRRVRTGQRPSWAAHRAAAEPRTQA